MTTITLEVPDALATRLAPLHDQLPQLLSTVLELFLSEQPPEVSLLEHTCPAFNEMLDFLASGPTPAQIVAFKVSPAAQERLEALLDKQREEGLTGVEAAELEASAHVNHLLLLLKARARLVLGSPPGQS